MFTIRDFHPDDSDPIVDLALEAWAPVFSSMAQTVGPEIFRHLFIEDWRRYQERDIRRALAAYRVSVAVTADAVVGYVAVDLPEGEVHGEIYMIAVDPDQQGHGIGKALTEHAVDQIRAAGRDLAMVETGGDPGHAPARATYEKAGLVSLPAERYFLAL
ncbi:MAG TPA: N-acetyltransferase [Acidimicrobiia bacterium]|nr:N-acetyltransferase [Acidimicrobiia bacterium]